MGIFAGFSSDIDSIRSTLLPMLGNDIIPRLEEELSDSRFSTLAKDVKRGLEVKEVAVERVLKTMYSAGQRGFSLRDVGDLVGDSVPDFQKVHIISALVPLLQRCGAHMFSAVKRRYVLFVFTPFGKLHC